MSPQKPKRKEKKRERLEKTYQMSGLQKNKKK